jgi:aminopeptidase N
MIPSIQLRGSAYGIASYVRPAMAYTLLRDVMGEQVFRKALREYMARWNGKHPLPSDFFFTFNDVAGEDLAWFWKPWFYEQGYPDLAIQNVNMQPGAVEVTVQRVGNMPVPVHLRYVYEDGTSETHVEGTSIWKDGRRQTVIRKNTNKPIRLIDLGSLEIPDVNLDNNSWQAR